MWNNTLAGHYLLKTWPTKNGSLVSTTCNPVVQWSSCSAFSRHWTKVRASDRQQGSVSVPQKRIRTPTQNHIHHTQEIPAELKSETSLPNYLLEGKVFNPESIWGGCTGRARYFKYIQTKLLESEFFFLVKTSTCIFDHAHVLSPKLW